MAESLEAKVRVVRTNKTGEVAGGSPEALEKADVDKIANIVNQVVVNFHENLEVGIEHIDHSRFGLSEVDITFGIDFEAKTKIPIIGPLLGIGVSAGATFQVHVKLTRGSSKP